MAQNGRLHHSRTVQICFEEKFRNQTAGMFLKTDGYLNKYGRFERNGREGQLEHAVNNEESFI